LEGHDVNAPKKEEEKVDASKPKSVSLTEEEKKEEERREKFRKQAKHRTSIAGVPP